MKGSQNSNNIIEVLLRNKLKGRISPPTSAGSHPGPLNCSGWTYYGRIMFPGVDLTTRSRLWDSCIMDHMSQDGHISTSSQDHLVTFDGCMHTLHLRCSPYSPESNTNKFPRSSPASGSRAGFMAGRSRLDLRLVCQWWKCRANSTADAQHAESQPLAF